MDNVIKFIMLHNAKYFSCIARCPFKEPKNYISKKRAKNTKKTTQYPKPTEFYNCTIPKKEK